MPCRQRPASRPMASVEVVIVLGREIGGEFCEIRRWNLAGDSQNLIPDRLRCAGPGLALPSPWLSGRAVWFVCPYAFHSGFSVVGSREGVKKLADNASLEKGGQSGDLLILCARRARTMKRCSLDARS